MTQVISMIQEKGGSGKSTLTLILAELLTADGATVAIIDCDPMGASVGWAEKAEGAQGLTLAYMPELDEKSLPKLIRGVKESNEDYDVLLIDTPAGDTKATDRAISQSDLVLIPVKPSGDDLKGLRWSVRTVEANIDAKRGDFPDYAIPTYAVIIDGLPNEKMVATIRETLIHTREEMMRSEKGSFEVLDCMVRHNTQFRKSKTLGEPLTGGAKAAAKEFLAALQITGLLDFYKPRLVKTA